MTTETTTEAAEFEYGSILAFLATDKALTSLLLTDTEFTVWADADRTTKALARTVRSDPQGILPALGVLPYPTLYLVDGAGRTVQVIGIPRPSATRFGTVGGLTPADIGRDIRVEAGRLSVEGQLVDFHTNVTWISDEPWGVTGPVRAVSRLTVTVVLGPATINDLPLDAKVVLL